MDSVDDFVKALESQGYTCGEFDDLSEYSAKGGICENNGVNLNVSWADDPDNMTTIENVLTVGFERLNPSDVEMYYSREDNFFIYATNNPSNSPRAKAELEDLAGNWDSSVTTISGSQ